jgi:hypothetical protein
LTHSFALVRLCPHHLLLARLTVLM